MEEENVEKDMTPILLKDLGMRYPRKKSTQKKRYGLYQCQYCGKEFEAQVHDVKNGYTKSCGCLTTATHGLTKHRLYTTWASMKARCYNEKKPNYKDYGGRGIQVCERWLDIANFIEDMYPTWEEGLSIDRIDVNANYEPDNCRWTTDEVQNRNTRDIGKNNTSGYRGVSWSKRDNKWVGQIKVENKLIRLGCFKTALEGAKAYETYVRLNNLEHNFTPALTEDEIKELNKQESQV